MIKYYLNKTCIEQVLLFEVVTILALIINEAGSQLTTYCLHHVSVPVCNQFNYYNNVVPSPLLIKNELWFPNSCEEWLEHLFPGRNGA